MLNYVYLMEGIITNFLCYLIHGEYGCILAKLNLHAGILAFLFLCLAEIHY